MVKHWRCSSCLVLLNGSGRSLSEIIDTYKAIIRSVLECVCIVCHSALRKQQSFQIEHIKKRCLNIACPADVTYEKGMITNNLVTLQGRIEVLCRNAFMSIQNESHRMHYFLTSPKEFCVTMGILENVNHL